MALVIIPTDCDWHAVFSLHDEVSDLFLGLYCEDCDATYPPEED